MRGSWVSGACGQVGRAARTRSGSGQRRPLLPLVDRFLRPNLPTTTLFRIHNFAAGSPSLGSLRCLPYRHRSRLCRSLARRYPLPSPDSRQLELLRPSPQRIYPLVLAQSQPADILEPHRYFRRLHRFRLITLEREYGHEGCEAGPLGGETGQGSSSSCLHLPSLPARPHRSSAPEMSVLRRADPAGLACDLVCCSVRWLARTTHLDL